MASETRGDWTKYFDGSGKPYYHNAASDVTQWSAPPEFAQEEEKSPWQQYIAADGKKYYFNAVTQETTWDEPAVGYTPAEPIQNKDDDDDNAADDSFVPLDSDAALETAEAEQERLDDEEFERQVLGDPIDNDSFDGQHYRFKKMLFDLKLPDNLTWTETMEQYQSMFSEDQRYHSIPSHRRAVLFGEFMIARKAASIRLGEKRKKTAASKFLRELNKMQPQVTVGMSYEDAQKVCESCSWWQRVEEADRQELYEDWEWNLQKSHWESEQRRISEASDKLKDELRSVVKSEGFTLSEFNSLFEKSDAYKTLPRKYRIDLFSAHIRQLEDVAAKNDLEEKKHKHWNSLMVREQLYTLLKNAAAAGEINYATTWKQVRDRYLFTGEAGTQGELLKGFMDPQYVGSVPRDLVEAFIETLRPEYKEWRQNVPAEADASLSLEEFRAQLRMSEAWPMLESREEYIPLVREERQHEAQLEAKMDVFKKLLKEKASHRSDRHFSDIRRRLGHEEAFQALEEEDARHVFDKWVREDESDRRSKRERHGSDAGLADDRGLKKHAVEEEKEEGEI